MIIQLAFVILIIWTFSLLWSGDLLSPVSIFCSMFIFALFCAMYNIDTWGFRISINTCKALLFGILVFVFISTLFEFQSRAKKKYHYISYCDNGYELKEISFYGNKVVLVIVMFLIFAILYFCALTRAAGTSDLSIIASTYRNSLINGKTQISFGGRLCAMFLRAFTNVFIYVIINNCLVRKFQNNHGVLLLFCVTFFMVITVLSGERTSLLRIFGIAFLDFSILWQRKYPQRKLISIKMIAIGVLSVIGLLYIFSAIRYFVGRSSELNLLDYVTFYGGCSIYNFDKFINDFSKASGNGHRTFLGLFNNLARLGFGEIKSINRENVIIPSKNIFMGNVYTAFYDYIYDYGFVGMIILIAIYAIVINKLYYSAKFSVYYSKSKCIIYSFVATTLFFIGFTEQFYSTYITVSTMELVITMIILINYIDSKRIGALNYIINAN